MCGIAAALAKNYLSEMETDRFRNLFFLNSFRGIHSSGVFDFTPTRKAALKDQEWPEVTYLKKVLPSYRLAPAFCGENNATGGRWHKQRPKLIVGHARAATVGAVSEANAHPFVKDKVIGVHNGTISGTFKGSKDFETDSEALIQLINDEGMVPAIERVTQEATTAAFALVVLNMDAKKLYVARNADRPLHVYSFAGTLYFSSAAKDLRYVMEPTSQGQEVVKDLAAGERGTIDVNNVCICPPDRMLEFDLSAEAIDFTMTKLPVRKTWVPVYDGWEGYSSYSRRARPHQYTQDKGGLSTSPLRLNVPAHMQNWAYRDFDQLGSADPEPQWFKTIYSPVTDKFYTAGQARAIYWWAFKNPLEFCEKIRLQLAKFNNNPSETAAFIRFGAFSKQALKNIRNNRPTKYFHQAPFVSGVLSPDATIVLPGKTFIDNELYPLFLKSVRRQKDVAQPPEQKRLPFIPRKDPKEQQDVKTISYGNLGSNISFQTSPEEYKNLLNKGCIWCSSELTADAVFWLSRNEPLCEVCQDAENGKAGFSCILHHSWIQDDLNRHIQARHEMTQMSREDATVAVH
jgi:Glutamine amidotransferase domain